MEEKLKQLMKMMGEMKTSQDRLSNEMKTSQEKLFSKVKSSQEKLSNQKKTEMKTSQEKPFSEVRTSQEQLSSEMKAEMKTIPDKLCSDMKTNQDKLEESRNEVILIQGETKQDKNELMKQLQEQGIKLEESMKNKLKGFEETVEKVISQIRNRVQLIEDTIVNMEVEMEKKISKNITVHLETEIERKMKSFEAKLTQLSTVGVVKADDSSMLLSRIKPPTFDGKVPWSIYRKQFEAAALANNWSKEEKTTFLIVSLRGEAMEILRSIPEDKQRDYDVLTTILDMRYGEAHLQHLYQVRLKTRQQRCEESIQEFEADIAKMVNLAYPTAPTDIKEQLIVSSFIDGLRDPEISQALRLARHRSAAEALAQALEIEAAKQASRYSHGHVRQIRTSPQDQEASAADATEELIRGIRDLLDRWQNDQRQDGSTIFNNTRLIRCWNCGTKGHMRNRCPQNTQRGPETHQLASFEGQKSLRRNQSPRGHNHCNTDSSRRTCPPVYQHFSRPAVREDEDKIICRRSRLKDFEEWDKEVLAKEQRQDPDLGPVVQWKIRNDRRPSWQDVSEKSPTLKSYWALWDSLAMEDGILKRIWESPDGKEKHYLTVLPRKRIPDILKKVHGGIGRGHFGINKTLNKVRERFYWLGSRSDVEEWCRKCETCADSKGHINTSRGQMRQYDVVPFERIDIDASGSFPRSRDEQVHQKIESDRIKIRYDLRAGSGFQVGEKVWLYNSQRIKGRSSKLQSSREGPYTIVTRLNDVAYRIQKNPRSRMKIVHVGRLTPCQGDYDDGGI